MTIRISHKTLYSYSSTARGAVQLLRLTPRDHEFQHVRRWRIDVDPAVRLRGREDWFGNICHMFELDGPFKSVAVTVEGEIETAESSGLVRGTTENFPPALFLRETELSSPSDALRTFVDELAPSSGGELDFLHAWTKALHDEIVFEPGETNASTTASQAFALRRGVCQDFAHMFIAGARRRGVPARYVSGYLARADGVRDQEASHAWAEAWVRDLGWVGFDPANGVSPTAAYVRVAAGLDYLGAAPILGARQGGGEERLEVRLLVEDQSAQGQE